MMTDLQTFTYIDNDVRTITQDGEPWFIAVDVCRILEISNVPDAVNRLDEDEKNTIVLNDSIPGNPNKTIISESGLYTLILGSRKPQVKAFKRWVTHEVIPAIKKHGIYAIDAFLDNPDVMIAALQRLKEERECRRRLELTNAAQKQQIAELQPKASYCDLILRNENTIPVTQIAKDYGLSGRAFNDKLHELCIQYRMQKTWVLYQDYADSGYTQSRTFAIDDKRSSVHTYWTQKGRLFLYNILKKNSILPLIEQNPTDYTKGEQLT